MRVPGEDAYWINRWGIFWDEIVPGDFVKVGFDLTNRSDPEVLPSVGSGFHAAIYKRRPDVEVICHSHATHLAALGCAGRLLGMYDQRAPIFLDDVKVFEQRTVLRTADSGLYFGTDEGELMAEALADGRVLLLSHHGVVNVGGDLATTVVEHIFLEDCARTQILATVLGGTEMPLEVARAYQLAGRESGRRIPSTWEGLLRRVRRSDPDLFLDESGDMSSPRASETSAWPRMHSVAPDGRRGMRPLS
jgi:ribulose-5-phosphate 4-epimerase/fuculose-1-phosphate aldolase